jgi:cell division protein FtsI/penicillin-binding protein 2
MNETIFKRRIFFVILLFIFISILFLSKLFDLHFSNKIIVPEKKKFEYKRGLIKDRNGAILAMSVELNSVFANPQEIEKPLDTARIVSRIIGVFS